MQASGLFTSRVKKRLTVTIVGDVDSLLLNVRATDCQCTHHYALWSGEMPELVNEQRGPQMRLQTLPVSLGQSQEVGNCTATLTK